MSKHNKNHQNGYEELAEEQLAQEHAEKEACEEASAPAEKTEPDYRDQYVRLYAEFDNYRKRTEREKAALIAYGKKDVALKMLPMYEVLLRQQQQMQAGKEDAQALQDGMRMILTELDKAFRAEGITKMEVKGKPYNPDTQEVVAMIPADKKQDGLVIDEVKMGFMMQDQVLRPASVVVGQAKEEN